ncbi:MAG: hypothetical protein CO093_07280 [Alphaproteobacteria bacterium CG_4_9_14_3_um_filter_47_13]|nr:MAG: hypothetical protein CO093_07280 [Alphaproteobacteria bacterium CG_4_9_14_3_um_filter_47_13]
MTDIKEKSRDIQKKKSVFPGTEPIIPDDVPLWPSAASTMKIDVAVNEDGMVWVIHDKPFPDYLEWIEFDKELGMMSFVTALGKIQGLGMKIHPPMDEYLVETKQVCVIMIRDEQIRDMALVPLNVQDYGLIAAGGKK